MDTNTPSPLKPMNNITFIITSPHYDSGIKSLGSKSIYPLKKQTVIEKQYKAIKSFCKNINHEIFLINNIDHFRTSKFIESKKLQIEYIYLDTDNVNHAGCLLKGLRLANYNTIVTIDSGLVLSKYALADTLQKTSDCDINIGCIGNKHKQNDELEVGCVLDKNHHVNNIFFGLDNKYLGINYMGHNVRNFILQEFEFDTDKNKFIFEIINKCISQEFLCKKTDIKSKDSHLIFSKRSLQQYIGETQ